MDKDESPAPTAAKVTVVTPPPIFLPWAHVIDNKSLKNAIQAVNEFEPKNVDPRVLKIAKRTALELIETLDGANGATVKFEANAGTARQLMVLVIPHNH